MLKIDAFCTNELWMLLFLINTVLIYSFELTSSKTNLPKFNYSSKYRNRFKPRPWFKEADCYTELSHQLCEPVQQNDELFCFGTKVHYAHLSLAWTGPTKSSQNDPITVQDALSKDFSGLPDCWPLLRELICSIQFAPCKESNKVRLVARDLCLKAKQKCRFLIENSDLWPVELRNCSDKSIFTDSCSYQSLLHNGDNLSFNPSGDRKCVHPLVASKFEPGWFPMPHCAPNCTSHALTESEHDNLRGFVHFLVIVFFTLTLFVWISLLLTTHGTDPKSPDRLLMQKCLNRPLCWYLACHLMVIGCWALQIYPTVRRLIVCREDGSLRKFEMAREQNYACVAQFFCLYCGLLGSAVWLCVFGCYLYLFNVESKKRIDFLFQNNKMAWLHLTWALPIVLVIYPLSGGKVEADGISGLCFIGYSEPWLSIAFVYTPITVLLALSVLLYCVGLLQRIKLNHRRQIVNNSGVYFDVNAYLSSLKLFLFYLIHCLALLTAWCIQTLSNNFDPEVHKQSLIDYLICQIKRSGSNNNNNNLLDDQHCVLKNRPDIRLIHLHIFTFFACTLITDVSLLFGTGILRVWLVLLRKSFDRLRRTFRSHCYLCYGHKNDNSVGKETQLLNSDDGGKISSNDERGITLSPLEEKQRLAGSSARSENRKGESQSAFSARLKNRAKNYQKKHINNGFTSRSSSGGGGKTLRNTPSSLLSTSLSSALNCSSVDLTFADDDKAKQQQHQNALKLMAEYQRQFWANYPMYQPNFGAPFGFPQPMQPPGTAPTSGSSAKLPNASVNLGPFSPTNAGQQGSTMPPMIIPNMGYMPPYYNMPFYPAAPQFWLPPQHPSSTPIQPDESIVNNDYKMEAGSPSQYQTDGASRVVSSGVCQATRRDSIVDKTTGNVPQQNQNNLMTSDEDEEEDSSCDSDEAEIIDKQFQMSVCSLDKKSAS